jgi:hypothetical protein
MGRHSFQSMAEHCNGLGRAYRIRQSLCRDTVLELVADTALFGAPVLPYLQGSRSWDDQKAVLPELS